MLNHAWCEICKKDKLTFCSLNDEARYIFRSFLFDNLVFHSYSVPKKKTKKEVAVSRLYSFNPRNLLKSTYRTKWVTISRLSRIIQHNQSIFLFWLDVPNKMSNFCRGGFEGVSNTVTPSKFWPNTVIPSFKLP